MTELQMVEQIAHDLTLEDFNDRHHPSPPAVIARRVVKLCKEDLLRANTCSVEPMVRKAQQKLLRRRVL